MKRICAFLICMFYLLIFNQLNGQDIIDSLRISFSYLSDFTVSAKYLDTTLTDFQNVDRIYEKGYYYSSISNSGHAHRSLLLNPYSDAGLFFCDNVFDKYINTPANTKYYIAQKPYSNIFYSQAPGSEKDESFFTAEHHQRIGKTIFFGAQFDFLNNQGFYSNQAAKNAHFNSYFSFNTKNYRYGFIVAYTHTRLNIKENGGIVYDDDFTKNLYKNRKTIDVNLNNASNLVKVGVWYLSQYFNVFKNDSLQKPKLLQIKHNVSFDRNRSIYEDTRPNTTFYNHFYTEDNSYIFDSTVYNALKNSLSFTNSSSSNLVQFDAGAHIDYYRIRYCTFAKNVTASGSGINIISSQFSNDKYDLYNFIPYIKFNINYKGFLFVPQAHYSIGNYNNNDYDFSCLLKYNHEKFQFDFMYKTSANDVPFMFNKISTTTASWNNNFNKTLYNIVEINASLYGIETGAKYMLINNYSYLNQEITPVQYTSKGINYFSAYIGCFYDIKRFEIGAQTVYQFTNNTSIIRIPDIAAKLTFIYKQPLFKKALMSQIGFDVLYNTPFYAEAYMPSIRSFYLQDDIKTGNFPYINAYLKFQIKRAKIFVELINVASGLFGYNYINVPHYPLNDRQFKFGVSWYFHD